MNILMNIIMSTNIIMNMNITMSMNMEHGRSNWR